MASSGMFEGVFADLPVPFEEDGSVDWFALCRILENCRLHGCRRFLFGGNVEVDGLSEKEKRGVLEDAVLAAGKRGSVIAVLCAREGKRALEGAVDAAFSGASAILLQSSPGLSVSGCLRLARAIAKETEAPVFLSASGRSAAECLALTGDPVCGFFEECSSIADKLFFSDFARRREDFALFAPDEEALALAPAVSYTGARSRLASCRPDIALRLWRARRSSTPDADLFRRALTLSNVFAGDEGLPALKWALHRLGLCSPTVRLPLCEPDDRLKIEIEKALEVL